MIDRAYIMRWPLQAGGRQAPCWNCWKKWRRHDADQRGQVLTSPADDWLREALNAAQTSAANDAQLRDAVAPCAHRRPGRGAFRKGHRTGEGRCWPWCARHAAGTMRCCRPLWQAAHRHHAGSQHGPDRWLHPDGANYDREIVLVNTLRIAGVQVIAGAIRWCACQCHPGQAGQTLAPLYDRTRVIGSSCIGASVLGGICNNSGGGALVRRGPSPPSWPLCARVKDDGTLDW